MIAALRAAIAAVPAAPAASGGHDVRGASAEAGTVPGGKGSGALRTGSASGSATRSVTRSATGSAAGSATEERAREYLLRSLTASARSRAQLADGLAAREVPTETADRLLDRFTEVGLVDDPALAHAIVRARRQESGAARRRIVDELRRKGIPADVAAEALAQVSDDDERAAAIDLAARRARRLVGLDDEVARRRLVGFLARKGYASSVCLDAARAGLAARAAARTVDDAGRDTDGDAEAG